MSGGHFNYSQYKLQEIAYDLQSFMASNEEELTQETKQHFEECQKLLQKTFIYVHRIDWFLSGDDSEESFHRRLQEDLSKYGETK